MAEKGALSMERTYDYARSLIRKYKWNSVLLRYWKQLLLAFVLPSIVVNSVVYTLYGRMVSRERESYLKSASSNVITSVQKTFTDIQVLTYKASMQKSPELVFFVRGADQDSSQPYKSTTLSTVTSRFLMGRTDIESIALVSFLHNKLFFSGRSTVGKLTVDLWQASYDETGQPDCVLPQYDAKSGKLERLVICRSCQYAGQLEGMMIFSVTSSYLKKLVTDQTAYGIRALSLVRSDGSIFYSTDSSAAESLPEDSALYSAVTQSSPKEISTVNSRNETFFTVGLASTDLTIVLTADNDVYMRSTTRIRTAFILCLLVSMSIPIALGFFLSLQFYRSIGSIVRTLSDADDSGSENEISFIIDRILQVTKSNRQYENELIAKIRQLKQTQSAALLLQFNPHFLFNTLNSVSLMAAGYAGGDNDASRVIGLLSDILYASMKKNYLLPLSEELEYAEKYIEICRIQYIRPFEFVTDVDKEALSCKVPQLMLQPILENAFKYGKKTLLTGGTFAITLSAKLSDGQLLVTVTNNGGGVPEQKLQELCAQMESEDILNPKHIGLSNINQRIRLLFGDEYGCAIRSDPVHFTVEMRLPDTH